MNDEMMNGFIHPSVFIIQFFQYHSRVAFLARLLACFIRIS